MNTHFPDVCREAVVAPGMPRYLMWTGWRPAGNGCWCIYLLCSRAMSSTTVGSNSSSATTCKTGQHSLSLRCFVDRQKAMCYAAGEPGPTSPGITMTKVFSLCPSMYGEACRKKRTNLRKSFLRKVPRGLRRMLVLVSEPSELLPLPPVDVKSVLPA